MRVALTVRDLREYLKNCQDDDRVVVAATLADGAVLGVVDLDVGTDQARTRR